jgi:hypothetical protein
MSYQYPQQPGYAQQQPSHNQQLPWPIDRLMNPMSQSSYGQPPVLPQINYLPQQFTQYYPLIVSACIDAIQASAQKSMLRVFLFNQMSSNGWSNREFTGFVEDLVRLLNMRMSQRVYQDIPSGATDVAMMYAELSTAANVANYPVLANYLDPQMMHGVQHVLRELAKLTDEIQRFAAPQGQYQHPQQYQQPHQNQHFQQPSVNDWRQNSPTRQTISPVAPIGASAIFGGGPVSQNATAAGAADRFSRFYSPYDEMAKSAPPPPPPPAVSHSQIVQDMRRFKEAHPQAQATNAPALPVNFVKASDEGVQWRSSKKCINTLAFDPNADELYYSVSADGEMKPVTHPKERSEMDMNKHLVVPSYVKPAPQGLDSLDKGVRAFEMEKALTEDAKAAGQAAPVQLNVTYTDDTFNTGLSLTELWFGNDVRLASMRKKENKVNLYRSCGLITQPVVSEKNPKPFLDLMLSAETFAKAHAILHTAGVAVNKGEHPCLDARLLSVINKRLTHRFNEFMKKQLAITTGWIDSFMEDINDVVPHVQRLYGDTARKGLEDNQAIIITQALSYAEEDFEKTQNETYLPSEDTEEGKEASKLCITYFYEYVSLTTLDLFSPELKLEIPKTEVAVGVFDQTTPLMRQIAENIFTHQKALNMQFCRHLVQTADGVILEVSLSVMHADFYLVATA